MSYKPQANWRKRNPWARHVEFARRRCNAGPDTKWYRYYIARGITVNLTAKEAGVLWVRDSAAKMRRPSLDRIDVKRNYNFDNCRFMEFNVNSRRAWDKEYDKALEYTQSECDETSFV